jgi:hypothetical protein
MADRYERVYRRLLVARDDARRLAPDWAPLDGLADRRADGPAARILPWAGPTPAADGRDAATLPEPRRASPA